MYSSHSDVSLYTDVVTFFFSFFSSAREKLARENERGPRERKIKNDHIFSSSPNTTPLRWRSINLTRFIFYHARSTDYDEKIEGP